MGHRLPMYAFTVVSHVSSLETCAGVVGVKGRGRGRGRVRGRVRDRGRGRGVGLTLTLNPRV